MNGKDFDDAMVRNMDWSTRKKAELDDLYERERARLNPSYNSCQSTTTTSKLEEALIKLANRFSGNVSQDKNIYTGDGLFVIASQNANIFTNQTITLTDHQFEMLLNRLMTD